MTKMIIQSNGFGQTNTIYDFLKAHSLNFDTKAFMKHLYHPQTCYCLWLDNQLIALLHARNRVLTMGQQRIQTTHIDTALTHPLYRHKGYFTQLLNALMDESSHTSLLATIKTDRPELFVKAGFYEIGYQQKFWLDARHLNVKSDARLLQFDQAFSLYQAFIQHFPVHFEQDQTHWQKELEGLSGQLWGNDQAYALVKPSAHSWQIEQLVYLNLEGLLGLLAGLGQRAPLSLKVSCFEALGRYLGVDSPRKQASYLLRLNQKRWWKADELKSVLNQPIWF